MVVKVQHPGIEETVRVDLNILMHLARFLEEHDPEMASYGLTDLAEESGRSLLRELDFRRELRNQQAFERNFAGDENVHIPRTYPDFSGKRILTMEYVDGHTIGDHRKILAAGHDPARLARVGADAFLTMVFEDGLFHADPHPGNVFVSPSGQITLLDFGMVSRLDEDLLDDLLDLLIAFVQSDTQALTRTVQSLGSIPPECDTALLKRDLAELQSELGTTPFDELDATLLLDQFTNLLRNHKIRLPAPLALLVKVLVMLDGTSRELDRNFSLMDLLKPHCERAIKKRHSPKAQLKRAVGTGRDWSRFLGRLPGVLDDLSTRIQNQNLRIDLDHRGLEATVDRLVSGLLCAAMLLGGSILWALKAPPTLFGVSILGPHRHHLATIHGVRLLTQLGKR